jgi:L-amino acid N-acyltransferase
MRLRLAEPDDAEAIRTIYNAEVAGSLVTFDIVPRTIEDQLAWLDRHQGAHPAVVAAESPSSSDQLIGAHGEAILGFGSLSPFHPRPAYATTVEDSVYVASSTRGSGVGRAILERLLELAAEHGFHAVIARTEGKNTPSINLHRACGFELVGVEREVGRKHGHWLDVVELQRML